MKRLICFYMAIIVLQAVHGQVQTYTYNNNNYIPETQPFYISANSAPDAKAGYSLVWNDEFEYSSLASLSANWDISSGVSPNNFVYNHIVSSTASFVTNDQGTKSLRMYANHLSTPIQNCYWEAAEIVALKPTIFGYFEARMKLCEGRGMWPAFWMFGNNGFTSGEGAGFAGSYNEIDFFEANSERDYSRNLLHNGYAWHYDASGNRLNDSYLDLNTTNTVYSGNVDYADQYHVFAVDFSPTAVTFYVDGIVTAIITNQSTLDKLKKNAMSVVIGMGMWEENVDYSTPSSKYIEVDYFRFYKRSCNISVQSHTCTGNNLTTLVASSPSWYSSLPTGAQISYAWSVSGSGTSFVGVVNTPTVTVNNTNNINCTVTCTQTITYPSWYVSSSSSSSVTCTEVIKTKFSYPNDISPNQFAIGPPQCIGGVISVTATGVTNPPGGLWQLWNTDANGNIYGNWLQQGYGTSITFNSNLQAGTTYAITRGTWDACTPWSFVQKNFKADVTEFSVSNPICTSNGHKLKVTCTAVQNIVGATWQLLPCDEFGVVPPNSTPVNGSGISYTFQDLLPNSYYKITRSQSTSCVNSTSKIVFIPDLVLNPQFDVTVIPDLQSSYFTLVGDGEISSPNSWWGVYNSNSSCAPVSQIGAFQSTSPATFGVSTGYYLSDGVPYLLIHAAYGECSVWNWRGYCVTNNLRQSGRYSVTEVELDSATIELLESNFKEETLISNSQLQCFPNPVSGQLTIVLPDASSSYYVSMVNSLGETVLAMQANSATVQLDLSVLPKGVYFLHAVSAESNFTEPVIIE